MAIHKIQLSTFMHLRKNLPVLDVRSPGEYAHAHIPGAFSFPLFTDEERKTIGTAYKQESRQKAVRIGLESFGKNLLQMVDGAEKILQGQNEVIVHCWRGGMRSAAVAWLLDLYGFKVHQLEGGYKSYRQWAIQQFDKNYPLGIVGGYTGSNKTGVIEALRKNGESVIDLEALAGHKGSAFGNLDRLPQPSQEQFENTLALALHDFEQQPYNKILWMEHESQRIGLVNLPTPFYRYYAVQAYYFLEVPFEERLKHIVATYGTASREHLINAIVRITKKLGGNEAKTAVGLLMDDDTSGCFSILLQYYDRLYRKNEEKRKHENRVFHLRCTSTDAAENARLILDHARN